MVTIEQKRFFKEHGYLRLEQVFTPQEVEELRTELDYIIHTFADWNAAWRGE